MSKGGASVEQNELSQLRADVERLKAELALVKEGEAQALETACENRDKLSELRKTFGTIADDIERRDYSVSATHIRAVLAKVSP